MNRSISKEMVELLVCFTHNLAYFVYQPLREDRGLMLVDKFFGRNLLVARSEVASFRVCLQGFRFVGGHLLGGQGAYALAR
jgi:hypothetical protein